MNQQAGAKWGHGLRAGALAGLIIGVLMSYLCPDDYGHQGVDLLWQWHLVPGVFTQAYSSASHHLWQFLGILAWGGAVGVVCEATNSLGDAARARQTGLWCGLVCGVLAAALDLMFHANFLRIIHVPLTFFTELVSGSVAGALCYKIERFFQRQQ